MMMSYIVGIGSCFLLAAIISIFWVRGIDYMKKNHPDYKGDDFLNWGNDEENDNDESQIM
jgi:hypothetical protein